MTAPRIHTLLLASTALLMLGSLPGSAGPDGPVVVGGQATVTGAGTANVQVNQTTNNAIINWNTFNIGTGQTTTFVQPGTSSVALNRVTGGLGPSEIYGTLTANGHVFLINPDGVLVGASGVINTAGFLATTSDIRNQDFMAGRYNFNIPGRPDASIVNMGNITATSGGFAALVAPGVRNSGTITATLGTVSLASGNSFTLDLYGDKLIQLAPGDAIASKVIDVATKQPLKDLVSNSGKLSANGGRVELTAAAARVVVDSVINNSGVIEANSIGSRNGKIVLGAATQSTKPAGAPVQTVKLSGTISAAGKTKGTKGGTIEVTGENIAVTGAKIDASGNAGGGKVLLGGDWAGGNPTTVINNASAKLENYKIATTTTLSVDAATTINASATGTGNGGKVILWSDMQTTFAGTIFARGGLNGGDGGFVEVSGKQQLAFTGQVDTTAPMGKTGDLLLDPANVTISTDPDTGGFAPTGNNSVINVTTLQTALATSNVTVTTSAGGSEAGNITVANGLTWAAGTTLTLHADNNIAINAGIAATAGGLTLDAAGTITTSAAGSINVGTFTLQNGAWTQNSSTLPAFAATDFRITGGSFLRVTGGNGDNDPYQIADVYGLQGIASSSSLLNKNYVLANDVDASGTANWNNGAGFVPIGNSEVAFSGIFNGQGHIIDGLTIARADSSLGLFGVNSGTIQNVGLTNVSISAIGASQFAGALAGRNNGTITNAFATGTVGNAVDANIAYAVGAYGGLVGQNDGRGTISQSYATVSVNVTGPADGYIDGGGLVGQNHGLITQSYANGAVSGTYSATEQGTYLGGLVGWNNGGTIQYSYATASVTGSGANGYLGGLVGVSDGGTITQAFASGAVVIKPGSTDSVAGGLIAATGVNTEVATTVTSSYWDKGTTGQEASAGGAGAVGLTSADALKKSSYVGWDFSNSSTWYMIDGQTRPFLQSEYSTTINNAHQLQLMAMHTGANYVLGSSINIGTELSNPSGMWSSQGFVPVGSIANGGFTGTFNGQGNTITGLTIAPTSGAHNDIGLFGTNFGTISNLYLANVSITADPNVAGPGQFIGALAGSNGGTITNVHVLSGTVNGNPLIINEVGPPISLTGVIAGGLVGQNGVFGDNTASPGVISNSSANVAVTVGDGAACPGTCSFNIAGGLVGSNSAIPTIAMPDGSTITDSQAFGAVTGGAFTLVGGLVGQNGYDGGGNVSAAVGRIDGTTTPVLTPVASSCAKGALFSCATGLVTTGSEGTAGGLVGSSAGIIVNTFATGNVTGASGADKQNGGNSTQLGGLVGQNRGTIDKSFATGNVGMLDNVNIDQLAAGGLVGENKGTITFSFATGTVRAGDNSRAGGLVGESSPSNCDVNCSTPFLPAFNAATISDSGASGAVTVGSNSLAGGLAGVGGGTFINTQTQTTSIITGGANSILGGLVGGLGVESGSISGSKAQGAVTGTGSNSMVGGLVGLSFGSITGSSSTGAVTGANLSYVGGLVGANYGQITTSYTTDTVVVSTTGGGNFVGGLAGMNSGKIDASMAAGNVSGLGNSVVGGLVGANVTLVLPDIGPPPSTLMPPNTFPVGTIVNSNTVGAITVSTGDGGMAGGLVGANGGSISASSSAAIVSGGSGASVGGLVGVNGNPPGYPVFPTLLSTQCEECGPIPTLALSATPGSIMGSSATGAVSAGANSFAGGLVGSNPGQITDSHANGNVTVTGTYSTAGGLVGRNDGTITSTTTPTLASNCTTGAMFSCATGIVSVAGGGLGGGLVGSNFGTIEKSFAIGAVLGADGVTGEGGTFATRIGGLAGINQGTITNVFATGNVGDQSGTAAQLIVAGGLVGENLGTIASSFAIGNVRTGANSSAGGLVGNNLAPPVLDCTQCVNVSLLPLNTPSLDAPPAISNSYATGNVTVTGLNAVAGGLVGYNAAGVTIKDSQATGIVAANADWSPNGLGFTSAGGLVGLNAGTITSSTPPTVTSVCATGALFSCAKGAVSVGANDSGGGLVGFNLGTIEKSFATGAVIGVGGFAGDETGGHSTQIGGLAGVNQGTITNAFATGNVGTQTGTAPAWIGAGGLVGENSGVITNAFATGNVRTGDNGTAGGLVGSNSALSCVECGNPGTGFNNTATISNSYATGNVAVGGQSSSGGGFVGSNQGVISGSNENPSYATGSVTGAGAFAVGGFVGANAGSITLAYAQGNVSNTTSPDTNYVGGFVGYNVGFINQAYAKGTVTGGDNSRVGGFVGLNVATNAAPGTIDQAYALGATSGGSNSVVAAFAAVNGGLLNETYGTGLVTGGAGSTTGGLVGLGSVAFSGSGTTFLGNVTSSYWDRQTTGQITSAGGTGVDTATLAGAVPAGWDPAIWAHGSYPHLVNLGDQNTEPGPAVLPPEATNTDSQQKIVDNLNKDGSLNLTTIPDVVNTQAVQNLTQGGGPQPPGGPQGPVGQRGPGAPPTPPPGQINAGPGRYFFIPPPGEDNYSKNHIVLQIDASVPLARVQEIAAQLGMTITGSQTLGLLGTVLYQFQFSNGTVAQKVQQLVNFEVTGAAPQYLFYATQDVAGRGETGRGDAAQYMLNKLALPDLHRTFKGTNIPIAVIDSEIDADHPDLAGVITDRYNATGVDEKPHAHGTGMAGAIGSHRRLVGTAPAAHIIAIRAFSTKAAAAESTSFNILKGLEYAATHNVRIVNMSFAGPRDPSLERALKATYDRGIILVAAAGNAGPRSPPLYPAADPNVIAVTATDMEDKLFSGANRGRHVAIAAPGVDILVPAPEGTYQMTTGTSVATAHVSGVIALMLERNPRLTPMEVRRILTLSARKLGPNDQFGAGLIDPAKAIQMANPRSVELMNTQPTDQVASTGTVPTQRQASVAAPKNAAPKTAAATGTTPAAKAAPKTASAKSEPRPTPATPTNSQPAQQQPPARWIDRWVQP